ncbi:MAG: helix-turn-helix transcriptional regulator [Archaeoglobaceae archaeon]
MTLKQIREQKSLTQSQLAKLVGVHQTYISRIERKKRKPRIDIAIEIAKALGVTVEELFGTDDKHED